MKYLHVYRTESGDWAGLILEPVAGIAGCDNPIDVLLDAREQHPNVIDLPGAQLFAAAPDLLEALKRALPTVEHMYHTSPDPDGSLWADVIACRAAIAKAEGQTP